MSTDLTVFMVRTDGENRIIAASTFEGAIDADYREFLCENEEHDHPEAYQDHRALIEQVVRVGDLEVIDFPRGLVATLQNALNQAAGDLGRKVSINASAIHDVLKLHGWKP